MLKEIVLMLLYRLGLTLAMIFTDFSGAAVASRIFGSYRFAIDMTITVYALSTLIYLFEIIIFIMIGVAAL